MNTNFRFKAAQISHKTFMGGQNFHKTSSTASAKMDNLSIGQNGQPRLGRMVT